MRSGRATRPGVYLAGLFLAALALRPEIIGVGPLLPQITADTGMTHSAEGLLSTIPVLCMGLFAPSAIVLARRTGVRWAVAIGLGLIAVGGLLRVAVPNEAVLLVFTLPVGIGIAVAGTLMPVAVKQRFAHRPAFATGVYATGIQLGAALGAALAVPLSNVLGGWRGALAAFSVASAVLVVPWLLASRGPEHDVGARRVGLPWRSPVAWQLVAIFGLIGTSFYGISHWLADAYVEAGWTDSRAGWLATTFQVATVPAGLVVPWLSDRFGQRRFWLFGSALVMTGAMLGILFEPQLAFLWATLLGAGNGALFALSMTLPLDVSRDPQEAGAAAAMMLGLGYTIVSLSPLLLGAVRDATGSFRDALWLIVGFTLATAAVALTLRPARLRRGVS